MQPEFVLLRGPILRRPLWLLALEHGDGIERDEAQAAHLFAAAAEQGMQQARNMVARLGTPPAPPPRNAPPQIVNFVRLQISLMRACFRSESSLLVFIV